MVNNQGHKQGSYRNLTGFPDVSRTILLLFPDFSRHLVYLYANNITKLAFKCLNFLYCVFFYSKYRTGLKFLNFELQMFCVTNCEKINKCMSNQQCNRHLHFLGQHYSFKDSSRLFKALEISTLNSRTFNTFQGSVQTLHKALQHTDNEIKAS